MPALGTCVLMEGDPSQRMDPEARSILEERGKPAEIGIKVLVHRETIR